MATSTITDKGQTTVPVEIREALGLSPRQQLAWEAREDGSAIVRPMRSVMELGGSLNSKASFPGVARETEAATVGWASGAGKDKKKGR